MNQLKCIGKILTGIEENAARPEIGPDSNHWGFANDRAQNKFPNLGFKCIVDLVGFD
jgi:hypothetical protein